MVATLVIHEGREYNVSRPLLGVGTTWNDLPKR
jgi:hypothetical protein